MTSKILIVDDQPGIRMLLEELFTSEGYETVTAKTGSEACDLVCQHDLDLMIMDYKLPVMSGDEVLIELDTQGIKFPVVIITGVAKESIQEETAFPFVKEIITKPFDIHEMKEMVNNVLVLNR